MLSLPWDLCHDHCKLHFYSIFKYIRTSTWFAGTAAWGRIIYTFKNCTCVRNQNIYGTIGVLLTAVYDLTQRSVEEPQSHLAAFSAVRHFTEEMKRQAITSTVNAWGCACFGREASWVCESCQQVKLAPCWSPSRGILMMGVVAGAPVCGVLHPRGAITLVWIIYVVFLICISVCRLTGPIFKPATDCVVFFFLVGRRGSEVRVRGSLCVTGVVGKRRTPPCIAHGHNPTESPWKTIQIPALHCAAYSLGGWVGVTDYIGTLLRWIPTPPAAPSFFTTLTHMLLWH